MLIVEAAKPVFSACTDCTDAPSAIPYSILRLSVELLFLVASHQKWSHHLQQVQILMPYNYIPLCTVYCLEKNQSAPRPSGRFTYLGTQCNCNN